MDPNPILTVSRTSLDQHTLSAKPFKKRSKHPKLGKRVISKEF